MSSKRNHGVCSFVKHGKDDFLDKWRIRKMIIIVVRDYKNDYKDRVETGVCTLIISTRNVKM